MTCVCSIINDLSPKKVTSARIGHMKLFLGEMMLNSI